MSILSTPLIRSFVGFDNLFEELNNLSTIKESNYPAYNIERYNENLYKIIIAVAGFSNENINIEIHNGLLTVEANRSTKNQNIQYLHKGIAERSFLKKFRLEAYIKVDKAELENGILSIFLRRILPEKHDPVKIKIDNV